jgi:hypothetical protein
LGSCFKGFLRRGVVEAFFRFFRGGKTLVFVAGMTLLCFGKVGLGASFREEERNLRLGLRGLQGIKRIRGGTERVKLRTRQRDFQMGLELIGI